VHAALRDYLLEAAQLAWMRTALYFRYNLLEVLKGLLTGSVALRY
jgi:hypothetical protein